MLVLDLCSGLEGWGTGFKMFGHEVFTVDNNPDFEPDLVADVVNLLPSDLPKADIIVTSPPCTAFSVASIGKHWEKPGVPKTASALESMLLVEHVLGLIKAIKPRYWWLENPRGMLRKLPIMLPYQRTTVTYCQYGEDRMKPTDLWGVWPKIWKPRPPCKNGDPCHEAAPRGSRTGTQGLANAALRAKIPFGLSVDVALACHLDNLARSFGIHD